MEIVSSVDKLFILKGFSAVDTFQHFSILLLFFVKKDVLDLNVSGRGLKLYLKLTPAHACFCEFCKLKKTYFEEHQKMVPSAELWS